MLLVGLGFHDSQALPTRLRGWGFRCHFAATLRVARGLFKSVRIHLVLTNTRLSDGTGLGLAMSLAGLPVTVFVCVLLQHSCLWLPTIDDGRICLGFPALLPSEFASSLEEMAGRFTSRAAI